MKIKLAELKLNDRNPRTISDKRFAALVKSVKDFPVMMELRPIITDAAGVIIGGNMRYRACLALGMTEIPAAWVRRADTLTAAERKRFIVMDNAGFGEWNDDILGADYDLGELEEWGLDMKWMEETAIPEGNKPIDETAMKDTENECPKCGFKW